MIKGDTMPYPFPGMNPYLEQPAFWSSVHSRLIVAIADTVAPQILPNYYIEVETRTYSEDPSNELLIGIPDAVVLTQSGMTRSLPTSATALQTRPQQVQLPIGLEMKERYLEVRETGTNAVVTVIELLSPKNKRAGKGRSAYENKRQCILESTAHLIEIDLLRIAAPMPLCQNDLPWDYRILVSRSEARPNADLYGFTLRERIPDFPLPLKQPEEFVTIDLQSILQGVYDRAGYDYRIDYQQPVPPPKLSTEEQIWLTDVLVQSANSGN
jgi:Protein of unknown function (DUF4058)